MEQNNDSCMFLLVAHLYWRYICVGTIICARLGHAYTVEQCCKLLVPLSSTLHVDVDTGILWVCLKCPLHIASYVLRIGVSDIALKF